ncbi:MAG: glutathione S-transferase family protein [Actinomycetota bacterium]
MPDAPYLLAGGWGSPYTRKVRAVLLYRRLPHQFLNAPMPGMPGRPDLPKPPLPLLPCLYFPEPDGTYRAGSDSTPLIQELDARHAERSVNPPDPALRFLSALVEDYADEWVTKQMFHYRWGTADGVAHANQVLPLWRLHATDDEVAHFGSTFGQRQIDRLSGVVAGSIEVTGPIIEDSYRRLLDVLRDHFREQSFLFGDRPSAGDFGLLGQLTQLIQVEPPSMALAREVAPRVMAWVDIMDDLSGWEVTDAGWLDRDSLGSTFDALLVEIGRTYAPFMVANAAAFDVDADEMRCEIDGREYWQKPFAYQRKCLRWMQEAHGALAVDDRAFVDEILDGTGCEMLFG